MITSGDKNNASSEYKTEEELIHLIYMSWENNIDIYETFSDLLYNHYMCNYNDYDNEFKENTIYRLDHNIYKIMDTLKHHRLIHTSARPMLELQETYLDTYVKTLTDFGRYFELLLTIWCDHRIMDSEYFSDMLTGVYYRGNQKI